MKKLLFSLVVILLLVTTFSTTVAVYTSDTTKKFYWEGTYNDVLRGVYSSLDFGNIEYIKISDQDLINEIPEKIKVMVIPTNAAINNSEAKALEKYMQNGGRIITFYESTLRFSDGEIRPNFVIGNYVGIQNKGWDKGDYNYIELNEKAKKIFGNDVGKYITTPRGFTFKMEIKDKETEILGEWVKNQNGEKTNKNLNAAIVMGKSGIYFGENIPLFAEGDDNIKKILVNSVRYLNDLEPAKIDLAKLKLQKVEKELISAKNKLSEKKEIIKEKNYNDFQNKLQKLEIKFEKLLSSKPTKESIENLEKEIALYKASLIESKSIQTRALWLDYYSIINTENPEGLRKAIKELHKKNYNVLIPEVFYQSRTILKDFYKIPQQKELRSWKEDPLEIIIEEAHKYGMEVHAWSWVFAIAHNNTTSQVMIDHPEWIEKDKYGNTFTPKMTAWLSHANDDARNWIKKHIMYIVENYDVDGINLDYIRYDSDIMGYDETTIKKYEKETGINPREIEKYTQQEVHWQIWRENLVTSFLKEIYKEIKLKKPEVIVSADVFGSIESSRMVKKQNWANWIENKYLDIIFMMDYDRTLESLSYTLEEQQQYMKNIHIYPGISITSANTPENVNEFLKEITEQGFSGYAIFSLLHLNRMDDELLNVGLLKKPAVPAHASFDKIIQNYKGIFEEQIDLYIQKEQLKEKDKEWFFEKYSNIEKISLKKEIKPLFMEIVNLKRESNEELSNIKSSMKIVENLYELMDILRPYMYDEIRKGKDEIKPQKPNSMVVVENPLPLPKKTIKKSSENVLIDGEIDDLWNDFNWSNYFVTSDTGKIGNEKTRVKTFYKDGYLYVLYEAMESDIKNINIINGERDDRYYLGDSVEMFILPDESKKEYYHYVISPKGNIYDEHINGDKWDKNWNGEIFAVGKIKKDKWILEMKVKIDELIDKEFRINFNRSRWRGKSAEYTSWSSTYGSFHTIERFGYAIIE